MGVKHSATSWPAPNFSIYCACIYVGSLVLRAKEMEIGTALFTKKGEGKSFEFDFVAAQTGGR